MRYQLTFTDREQDRQFARTQYWVSDYYYYLTRESGEVGRSCSGGGLYTAGSMGEQWGRAEGACPLAKRGAGDGLEVLGHT